MAINKTTEYITNPNIIPVDTNSGEQPLAEALDNRIISIASIAELKDMPTSGLVGGQAASVTTTGRAGDFTWVDGDQSSNVNDDSQEGVWVAPDSDASGSSGAWERSWSGHINVMWFGAIGDGATDDTAALQGAINYASLDNKTIFIPATDPDYRISGTLTVASSINIMGDGEDSAKIRNHATDGSDAIRLSDTEHVRGIYWRGFSVICESEAGHCIDVGFGIVRSEINIRLSSNNPDKSCVNGSFPDGGGCYDTTFTGGEWRITDSHNVPGFKIVADGTFFNTNTISPKRVFYGLGSPWFHIECTDSQNWLLTNTFYKPELEVVNGGAIALFGCRDTTIFSPIIWDLTARNSGVMENDGILLSSTSGRRCENTRIINYQRTSGTLGSGVFDVRLDDASNTIFDNCNNPSSSPTYEFDFNNRRFVWIGEEGNISKTNDSARFSTYITPERVTTPSISVRRNSSVEVINDGQINATSGFITIDTEGEASSDTLTTINGGEDGMIIIIRTNSASRDVTVAHNSNNIMLPGRANVELDHNRDRLMLQYDAQLSVWVGLAFSNNFA